MDINQDIYEEKYVRLINIIYKYLKTKISYLKIGEVRIIFIVKENVF